MDGSVCLSLPCIWQNSLLATAETPDASAHLSKDIIPEEFARTTDAALEVEGKHLCVHKAILSAASPVFASMFASIPSQLEPTAGMQNSCIPLPGHSHSEVQTALIFIYQRSGASVVDARKLLECHKSAASILQFAHKFNMQGILKECDCFLAAKADAALPQSRRLFNSISSAATWVRLAERCELSSLLAHSEFFLYKHGSLELSAVAEAKGLSSACLLRLLHCAQVVRQVSRYNADTVSVQTLLDLQKANRNT